MKTWARLAKLGRSGFVTTAFQRELFQTLVHIAIASFWVIARDRVGCMRGSFYFLIAIDPPSSWPLVLVLF